MAPPGYRIGIDIGGTFTDVVIARDDGLVETRKVPSTPDDYSRGIAEALQAVVTELDTKPDRITGIVHATTVATNAILEYKGARTGLLTTEGFRDVLEMRRLRIPVLYDLQYDKPKPLAARHLRLEVSERLGPDGAVRIPLREADVVAAADLFRKADVGAVAISFLHAYANPQHEIAAERILRAELGDGVYICRGSEILPEIREYERTSTVVVNAYIGPVVRNYAAALTARLASIGISCPVEMMHSGGGIMRLGSAVKRAASLVESGPAAGVIACARLVSGGEAPSVISFDMGGTTAKAALIEKGAKGWAWVAWHTAPPVTGKQEAEIKKSGVRLPELALAAWLNAWMPVGCQPIADQSLSVTAPVAASTSTRVWFSRMPSLPPETLLNMNSEVPVSVVSRRAAAAIKTPAVSRDGRAP